MKLRILILGLVAVFIVPAFADENLKLIERKTCEQIKSEIAAFTSMGNLSDEQQTELKQLTAQQRANCGAKSSGRRTINRVQLIVSAEPSAAPIPVSNETLDALAEYMNNKKSNCEKLNTEIEKIAADKSKDKVVAEMRTVYDADCVDAKPAEIRASADVPPAKTDEEWAAEYDANLAAGLCGDGTKPNKFGCCTDEVFKDLGNDGFACCPKNGDYMCFPPITKAE